jgi:hypothetical protein
LVWILAGIHYFFANHSTHGKLIETLALAAVIGTHVLGETHTVATLSRVYKTAETRKQFSLYTHWGALAFSTLALAGMFIPGVTPILAKIYLIWVAQHFTAQSYGLTLLYCYKANYFWKPGEKKVLWMLMNSTAAFAILRQFTYREWNPDGFLAQRIPFWGPLPEWVIILCATVIMASALLLTMIVLSRAVRDKTWMPLPAVLMLVTGVAIFMVGRETTGLLFLYVPAFYHGSQYVVLSIAYYLKERSENGTPQDRNDMDVPKARNDEGALRGINDGSALTGNQESGVPKGIERQFFQAAGFKYMGFLMLGAIAIYIGAPRLLEEFGFSYSLSFATIFCAVNLHHFLTDQGIWKLRDPNVRKKLIA